MRMTKRDEDKKRQSQHFFFSALMGKPPNAMKKKKKSATWRKRNTRGTRKQIKNCAVVLTRLPSSDHLKVLVASRRALAMSTPIRIPWTSVMSRRDTVVLAIPLLYGRRRGERRIREERKRTDIYTTGYVFAIKSARRELRHGKTARTNERQTRVYWTRHTAWTTRGRHDMRKARKNLCTSMVGSVMTDQFGPRRAAKMGNTSHHADEKREE